MNFKIEEMLTVVDRSGGGLKGLGVTDSLWHLQVTSGACRLFGGPANVEQGFAVALAYACTCRHVQAWGQAPACTVRFGGVRPGGLSGIHEGTRHRLAQREHRERAVDSGVSIRVWGSVKASQGRFVFS